MRRLSICLSVCLSVCLYVSMPHAKKTTGRIFMTIQCVYGQARND